MAMHDVDLLPLHDSIDYSYPKNNLPYHVSASGLHPEYNYSTFIGGILLVTRENFLATNGMSNRYWGWGKEDDDLFLRLKNVNLTIDRPDLSLFNTTMHEHTFWHNHKAEVRVRDRKRFKKQKRDSLVLDYSGLDTMQYKIESLTEIEVENYSATIVNVELGCNRIDTHWCSFEYQFLE
jgi:xylosylprotein 4-beta-galactosyltransferase